MTIGHGMKSTGFQLYTNFGAFILEENGFTTKMIAIFSISGIIGSFLGALAIAIFVDKTKRYLQAIRFCYLVGAISFALASFFINYENLRAGVYVMAFFVGASQFGSYSTLMELAAETTYPVGAAASAATLSMFGHIIAGGVVSI